MKIYPIFSLGDFGTNCYIIETSRKNALLIDAPYSASVIKKELDARELTLKKILLTHGHCDHIEALGELVSAYGCEVFISDEDRAMLTDRRLCLAEYFGSKFTPFDGALTVSDGDEISLDDVSLKVIQTPGHSAGSVCYATGGSLFTGDTLFEGTVGRTDLGGNFNTLLRSIEKLYRSGKNYVIYPGHGGVSDLDAELRYNPYLEELREKI